MGMVLVVCDEGKKREAGWEGRMAMLLAIYGTRAISGDRCGKWEDADGSGEWKPYGVRE